DCNARGAYVASADVVSSRPRRRVDVRGARRERVPHGDAAQNAEPARRRARRAPRRAAATARRRPHTASCGRRDLACPYLLDPTIMPSARKAPRDATARKASMADYWVGTSGYN